MENSQAHLLVVDDLDANLFAMKQLLMPLGAKVSTATSAAEGLRMLLHEKVDVLILDYSMPGLNGLEMAKLVNQQFADPPPILFLTAHGHNVPGLEASCYEQGAMDFIEKPVREEVLLAKLNVLIKLTEQKEELRRLADTDSVTQIKNRVAFGESLSQNLSLARRQEAMLALLALDLDDFKRVNDTYGHAAGDLILREFAKRITLCTRDADVVARIGGDEFCVLLTSVQSQDDVDTVCNKILSCCRAPVFYGEQQLELKVSIGVALFPHHGSTAEGLMKAADVALYQAKSGGKGRCTILQGGFRRIRGAEDMDELMGVSYQPLFPVNGDKPVGSEILANIADAEQFGGTEAIIRHFRQLGHGETFENSLQKKVCNEFPTLGVPEGGGRFFLFLNEMMADFHEGVHVNTLCNMQHELAEHNLQLVLDLPDWERYGEHEDILDACKTLQDSGVMLCLQDVGEKSIPNHLMSDFSFDFLKLSMELVREVVDSEYARKSAAAAISIAKSVGCRPIAMGVETKEQYNVLKKLGCTFFQGAFWAMPVPLEELTQRWLQSNVVLLGEAKRPAL